VAFGPDGRYGFSLRDGDGALTTYDLETGEIIQSIVYGRPGTWGMDVTPDGRALVGAFDIGTALLYDLSTGEIIHRFVHVPDPPNFFTISDLDISPDGRTAVTAAQNVADGAVLWDLETGEEIQRLQTTVLADNDIALSASYSPDGRMIAVGLLDGKILIYDVQTFKELIRFGHSDQAHISGVMDVAFSPDGKTVVSASQDTTLILWDVETGTILRRLAGHSAEVRGVAFSPDGSLVASTSFDRTAMIWDVASGQPIRRYVWNESPSVYSIAFSPDGKSILLGGTNSLVSLWQINPTLDDLLAWVRENRFVLPPTCIQRQIYDLKPLCETTDP
jgi:WD40 repeat protein